MARGNGTRPKRILLVLILVVFTAILVWSCVVTTPTPGPDDDLETQPSITISSALPSDIPGGAPAANLQQAASFAWQEFIALNWPAQTGMRDTPDNTKLFGDQSGALVWHTYRAKVEIYPGTGNATSGPHGYQAGPPNYGYDDPPQYDYASTVAPCSGQSQPAQPAWINLDETSQIGLDQMFAGIVPNNPGDNSAPQLIRFLAKANRAEYTYVAANEYWYNSPSLMQARKNFTTTMTPASPYVDFPDGTIEIKAAWRQLAPTEDANRFYTTTVRYYEPGPCYREATWALLALHIIHKTPTAPSFIYATFEQADNILTLDSSGKYVPVEDVNGNVINRPTATTSTTPALTYQDSPTTPTVSIVGADYCTNPGEQIFYVNSALPGLPSAGNICLNYRDNAIPADVIAVNQAAHSAISAYNSQNGISQSPWSYYKLVNVQWVPFDKSTINSANRATFYQANSVVETNYTLQMFSGRIANNGAPSDYPMSGSLGFQNVHIFGGTSPSSVASYDMGGCMGCHGNAQLGGSDFSFILGGPVTKPDFPASPGSELIEKYLSTFITP